MLAFALRRRTLLLTLFAALLAAGHAEAIPSFAHEYGLTCQKCHTVVPRLNDFGQAFADHGFALPGAIRERAVPFAMKLNLAYSSDPDPTGLPKAVVDEIELFLAGTASSRTNYFVEQYLVDGGRPGATRDAWFGWEATSSSARFPVYLQAGAFTLPLPVDPESFRESSQHYTIFDQTVGTNPFNVFEPRTGVQARLGAPAHGVSFRLAALQGHDPQSGLPSLGTDTAAYVQEARGAITLSAYRYDGSRPDGANANRFWRQGYGLVYASGRWESDSVVQAGHDTSIDGAGKGAASSGGFTQLRYAFDRRLFGLVRYEGTSDPTNGLTRDLVPLLGYRTSPNARLTIEDVLRHRPRTSHTFNTQFTVAY